MNNSYNNEILYSSLSTGKDKIITPDLYNKHYIILHNSYIVEGWSNGPRPNKDTSKAICINEKGGYQFRLFPDGEENPSLFDANGIPLYKYEDEEILPLTQAEKNIYRTIQENKQLPTIKLQLIADSKKQLEEYLNQNPLIWTDNKPYSVTQEKQALLTQQLALYAMDENTKLYWNASGEECKVWSITALAALAKSIADYIRPFVRYQQQKETEINQAETAEEARAVLIDYSTLA